VAQRHHRDVTGQGQVDRVVAVAVHDGGDLAVTTDAAGGALAELGTDLSGDLLCGHVALLVSSGPRSAAGLWGLGTKNAVPTTWSGTA
jgi:hypothetical protein